MANIKAVFYLPIQDNDGRDLTAEIEEVRTELYVQFGGWTFQGYVQGAFRMADDSQSLDVSAVYIIVLDESRVDELEAILRDFKSKTLQEAIYLELQHEVEVRFVR